MVFQVLILVVLLVPSAVDPARVVRHLNSQSEFVRFDLPSTSLDPQQGHQMQQYYQVHPGPPLQPPAATGTYVEHFEAPVYRT